MKNVLKIIGTIFIVLLTFTGCREINSEKTTTTTNEMESASPSNSEQVQSSDTIVSNVDFSSAKTSSDSLAIIESHLKKATTQECCCKYYNMGRYHYEKTSKSSCDDVLGTCVDASNCK